MNRYKPHTSVRINQMTEEQLAKRLVSNLAGIFGVSILLVVSFLFFGPKIAWFFAFVFGDHNSGLTKPVIKINAPIFSNVMESTNTTTVSLSGYSAPGSTVKLYVNGPEAGNATADANGAFTFSGISLYKGRNTLFAKAIDDKNNQSDPTNTFSILVDTEKPKITLDGLKDGDTVKNLDKRIIVKGSVSEEADVKINDRIVIVKPDHTFEFTLGADEGNVKITVVAIDTAGNKETKELTVKYVKGS